jgi:hypothetical protein
LRIRILAAPSDPSAPTDRFSRLILRYRGYRKASMTEVCCSLACASTGAIMTPPSASQTPLTPLRAPMLQQMQLHRLAPSTQQLSLTAITAFTRSSRRSPEQLTPEEMRAYLHHRLEERTLAWSPCHVAAAAIRFFSVETLDWPPCSCPSRHGLRPTVSPRSSVSRTVHGSCPAPATPSSVRSA